MTLPLNDGSPIVRGFAPHIQALAAVTGHELIASCDSLDAPLLILTTMTLPLNDLRTIVC